MDPASDTGALVPLDAGDSPVPLVPAAAIGAATGLVRAGIGVVRRLSSPVRATATRWAHGGPAASAPAVVRRLEPWADAGRAEVAHLQRSATEALRTGLSGAVDLVLDAVDLDAVLARVDVDGVIRRVDVDALLRRVDVDGIVRRVDVAALMARVDVDGIVAQVDVERIVDRIDVERIVDRIDIDGIVARVDVDAIVTRVDVEDLVNRTEIGRLVVASTGGVASEAVDLVRSQGVGLDGFVARVANRVLRRAAVDVPAGPPLLVGDGDGAEPPAPPAGTDGDADR